LFHFRSRCERPVIFDQASGSELEIRHQLMSRCERPVIFDQPSGSTHEMPFMRLLEVRSKYTKLVGMVAGKPFMLLPAMCVRASVVQKASDA
jgi:hypothetical protein